MANINDQEMIEVKITLADANYIYHVMMDEANGISKDQGAQKIANQLKHAMDKHIYGKL